MFEYPVLLGDIGGTNARFGLVEEKGATARILTHEPTKGHPHLNAAIRASLEKSGTDTPRSAVLAIAGRVDAPEVQLTNAHWVVAAGKIGPEFGFSRVVVVNDYVPVAAGAAGIAPDDITPVNDVVDPGRGARLVLGPGTGFGAAALVPYEDRLAIVSTEAGHTDFGPGDDEDMALWPSIERIEGRVTVEALLSGPGLTRLHAAVRRARGGGGEAPLDPAEVTERGLSGADPHAAEAIRLFSKYLGRVCGDLALTFLANGGVYIGGGIAPRILDVMQSGGFREAFEHKPPFADMMRLIPTSVITVHDPALNGLAALASEGDRFIYHGQNWQAD